MRNATIISTGAFAPENIIPNSYFNELFGAEVDTWLRSNLHIYERRWCGANESTADLAEKAGQQAIERAGITPDAINLIIIATDTPEFISPSTSSVVQHRLKAVNAGTFDINTACCGFVTALDIAAKYIRADSQYEYVLVIGAYAMSKYLNKKDKKTVTIFGDGAGAVLLKAKNTRKKGFQTSQLITEGQYNEWMGIYAGGTKTPISPEVIDRQEHQLVFAQRFSLDLNPDKWTIMTKTLCERMKISPTEVSRFFITQININNLWETMDRLNVPREKAHTIMQHYAYTGSACIPMAFNDAWEKNLVKKGDLVFFIGSGGGLAFASAAFRI